MMPIYTSRRRFLAIGAQALIGAGIGLPGLSWLTGCSSNAAKDPSGIWNELSTSLNGQLTAMPQQGVHQLTVNLLGQLVGREAELTSLLAPVYAVASPSASTIREMSYWNGQAFLSEEGVPEYSHERYVESRR
jgi:hypothetical protein